MEDMNAKFTEVETLLKSTLQRISQLEQKGQNLSIEEILQITELTKIVKGIISFHLNFDSD